ncbi:chromosome assembly factor 1, putative [Plasmodium ovale wallikeri]|uniref:Protein HIRA n=1 Tax=Plasmodium ovale wallikeri TaxID=864142 RepID=A0A1A8YYK0_PLAOA|nr:chromosome assembly factor 1, putative [Plasmodium ovale wallikeri]SBT57257.1 chromosome assembly factor 1, putative [Plasmodium ovale wallikeri]
MPQVYLPQILWHSKDNKRSDRIYSIDIQPYPNFYSVKKLSRKYELFKKFLKDKENKYGTNHFQQNEERSTNSTPTPTPTNDKQKSSLKSDKDINCFTSNYAKNDDCANVIKCDDSLDHPNVRNLMKDKNKDNENNLENKCTVNNTPKKSNILTTSKDEGRKKAIKFNIATCGADEFVHLWRIYVKDDLTVKCLSRFIGHNGEINCVRFNKNGRYLASGGEDKFVYVWEKSKKPKNIPLGYDISFLDYKEWWNIVGSFRCSGVINSIIWSNNDTLYIGNEDNNINIIEFVKNANCKVKVLEGHAGIIQGISLDINNEILASLSADQTLKIWKKKIDGKTWKLENSIKNVKTDQLEKRSTTYITYDEYEYNEKHTDKYEQNISKKEERKEYHDANNDILDLNENKDMIENQRDKEKKHYIMGEKLQVEDEEDEKNICTRKQEEIGEEEQEEEEEEKRMKRCLFSSEEMLPSFFRRIDFSPNGEFLIAPSGIQFEQVEKINEKNNKLEENIKTNYQIKAYSCFYIYHKNLFIKYNIPFFTVFSQTSHFLVAKFNYNIFRLRTQQNILKKCYKHLLNTDFDMENEQSESNKKRKTFDESFFRNELKNHDNLLKLSYEKTLLFNDNELQDDVSEDISSTISDMDVHFDYDKESMKDSTWDCSLSNNPDKAGEAKKGKSECEEEEGEEEEDDEEEEEEEEEEKEEQEEDADVEEEDTDAEEEDTDAEEEDTDAEEEDADSKEQGADTEDQQNAQNGEESGAHVAADNERENAKELKSHQHEEKSNSTKDNENSYNEEKTNDPDAICETKDKKEERFVYALGTFDGSVYFYDSEILDMPIGIVKNIHLCPITDISWNNLGNICACSSSDGYVSFYYFHQNELGDIKSYKNYYFDKKCNDLTFNEEYFENTFYDEVDFLNRDEANDYTSSEDECDEVNLPSNKEETKVRRFNLIVGNAATYVLEQNTKK